MTKREQGNVGEAVAIAELTKQGYTVSIPVTEDNPYDLVVERNGQLYAVQVKSTSYQFKGGYQVELRTRRATGGRGKNNDASLYDFLFVWTPEQNYLIPSESATNKSGILLKPQGKYGKYIV